MLNEMLAAVFEEMIARESAYTVFTSLRSAQEYFTRAKDVSYGMLFPHATSLGYCISIPYSSSSLKP